METDTAFPARKDKEATYAFSKEYRALFDDILAFAREYVSQDGGSQRHRRVRYWSALALLRCVSSSPAAAVATLRRRAAVDLVDDAEVDEVGRRTVLDQDDADDVVTIDFSPGSDNESGADTTRRKLLEFARRAGTLSTANDHKLERAVLEVKAFLKDGFHTNPVINASDPHDLSRVFPDALIQDKISRLMEEVSSLEAPLFVVHINYRGDTLNESYQNGLLTVADATGGKGQVCRSVGEIPDAIAAAFTRISSAWRLTLGVPPKFHSNAQIHLSAPCGGEDLRLSWRTRLRPKEG